MGGGTPALLSRGFRAASDILVWKRGGRKAGKKEETGLTARRRAGRTSDDASHRSDGIYTAGWNVSGSACCLIFQLGDELNSSHRRMKSLFL